jgi:hypothetical protein
MSKRLLLSYRKKHTLKDFFGVWLKCYTSTKLVVSVLANDIIIAMDTRGSVLKNNSVFLAGI